MTRWPEWDSFQVFQSLSAIIVIEFERKKQPGKHELNRKVLCVSVSDWVYEKRDFFVVPIKILPHYIILIDYYCCATQPFSFIKRSYFTWNHLKYDITCTSDVYIIKSGRLLSIYCSFHSLFIFHYGKTGYRVWNCIDRPSTTTTAVDLIAMYRL